MVQKPGIVCMFMILRLAYSMYIVGPCLKNSKQKQRDGLLESPSLCYLEPRYLCLLAK